MAKAKLILTNVTMQSFGALRKSCLDFEDTLNLSVDPNGDGGEEITPHEALELEIKLSEVIGKATRMRHRISSAINEYREGLLNEH
jgi:hypothetical protein